MTRIALPLAVLICLAAAGTASAAAGVVMTRVADEAVATAIAQQRDGKLVVGASANPRGRPAFAAARYSARGVLDRKFGKRGTQVVAVGLREFEDVEEVLLLPGGRILIGGTVAVAGRDTGAVEGESGGDVDFVLNQTDFGFAQLTARGALDRAFGGGDGVATVPSPLQGHPSDALRYLVAGAGNRLLFGGEASPGSSRFACAMRTDLALGADPAWSTPCGPAGAGFNDALPQSDGSAVVAHDRLGGSRLLFGLSRLTPSGEIDPGFGGEADLGPFSGGVVENKLARRSGGYVVAGTHEGAFALVGFTATGAIDPSFGSGGITRTRFGGDDNSYLADLIPAAGGGVLAVGFDAKGKRTIAARYDKSGRPVRSFGRRGVVALGRKQLGHYAEAVGAVVAQQGGKFVVAGTGWDVKTARKRLVTLVRLTSGGKLDRSFGR